MNINYKEQIKQVLEQMPSWFVYLLLAVAAVGVILALRWGYSLRRRRRFDRIVGPAARNAAVLRYDRHSLLNPGLWILLVLLFPIIGTVLLIAFYIAAPLIKRTLRRVGQKHPRLRFLSDPELPCSAWIFVPPILLGWAVGYPLQPLLVKTQLDGKFPLLTGLRAPILQIALAVWFVIAILRLMRLMRHTLYVIPHEAREAAQRTQYLTDFVPVTREEVRKARTDPDPRTVLHCFAPETAQSRSRYPELLRDYAAESAKGVLPLPGRRDTGAVMYQWNSTQYAMQLFRTQFFADAARMSMSPAAPASARDVIVDPCDAAYRGFGVTEIAVLLWYSRRTDDGTLLIAEQERILSGSVWRVMLPIRYWLAETVTALLGTVAFCSPAGVAWLSKMLNLFASFFH